MDRAPVGPTGRRAPPSAAPAGPGGVAGPRPGYGGRRAQGASRKGWAAGIEVLREPNRLVVLVRLSGEFDAHDLEALREALDGAASPQGATFVDLSGVTFMDAPCGRELAARARRDRLSLRNPSWQARASLGACGLAARSGSRPAGEPRGTRETAEIRGTKDGTASLSGAA